MTDVLEPAEIFKRCRYWMASHRGTKSYHKCMLIADSDQFTDMDKLLAFKGYIENMAERRRPQALMQHITDTLSDLKTMQDAFTV